MIIPKSIRIGSCDYDVDLTDKTILHGTSQCYGHISWEQHIIEVDKTLQDLQGQEITFLHEMIHGILHERNLEIEDEELIVTELSKGLHQIIRDNPEIFRTYSQCKVVLDSEVVL